MSEATSAALPAGSAAAPLPLEAFLSLFLALLGLTCILGGFYAGTVVLLGADASGDSGPPTNARMTSILVVWMATCLAYFLFAFRWMLLHSSGLAGQRQGTQNDAEVQQILDDLCEGSKISRPRLRIVDSAVPNTRSVGLSPSFGHLEISRGLIDAVVATGGPDALRAVLAHELVHLRLFDTFFFTIIGPPLAVARGLLTVLSRARTAVGQFGQGFNAGPFVVLAMLTKGSPLGCLVALLAGALLIGCLSVTLFYAASFVGVLMGMVALCLAYSRFVEQRADCRAVEMLGSSRGMVDALAACLPAYPGEMTRVHRYAKTYLPDIAEYTPDHLLASLAAGGDPDVGTPAAERLFRTHPPFMRPQVDVHAGRIPYRAGRRKRSRTRRPAASGRRGTWRAVQPAKIGHHVPSAERRGAGGELCPPGHAERNAGLG